MSLYLKFTVAVIFPLLSVTKIIPKEVTKEILVILGLFYIMDMLKDVINGFTSLFRLR